MVTHRTSAAAHRTPRRLLAAFVILGVLALGGIGTTAYYAGVVIPESYARVWKTERLAQLTASVSQRCNDIGVVLAHNVPVPASLSPDDVARIQRDLQLIRSRMRELRPSVGDEERASLRELDQVLDAFQDGVTSSIEASANNEQARFQALVETNVLPSLTELVQSADELNAVYSERSIELLSTMNQEIEAMGVATLIFGGVFLAILVGGAVASMRMLAARDRAIEEQLERLEQVNSDLEAFAGRVAHDLRGPLMPILLSAAALKQRAQDADSVLGAAGRIERSAERAVQLIDSLLAFSRAAEPSPSERCHAAEVVAQAVDETAEEARRQHVEIEVDVQPLELAIAPSLFRQVVQNLLANALRFAGHRGPPRVRVRLRERGDDALLEVMDNGPGIPKAQRTRVFEPFFRLEYREGGTGLGLATVRRVAEAHGGTAGVGDSSDGGACVWVRLPRAAPLETPHARVVRASA